MYWSLPVLPLLLVGALAGVLPAADDVTTLDGKTYKGVELQKTLAEGPIFLLKGKPFGIKWSNLPPDLALKYRCEGAIIAARTTQRAMKLTDAFRLDQLAQATAKAQAEGKPLGFVMVWGSFFEGVTGDASLGRGSVDALVHFYTVFNDSVVLVFVRHETELGLVPPAVAQGFNGPDEGGNAPNLCIVDPTAETYICEIPMGGKGTAGPEREKLFRAGIEKILAAKETWMKPAAATGKKK